MSIKSYTVGELQVNCYFIINDETKEIFIIDPGAEPERLIKEIKKYNLVLLGIINTHGHADHIGGNSYIRKKYNIPIYIHSDDQFLLVDARKNISAILYFQEIVSPAADKLLNDDDTINLGKIILKVLHTPGHTSGSICLLYNNEYVFTGDTLFCGSVGRWDLPGGNEAILMNSLKKLKSLPKSMIVLPGHGPESTISDEIVHNPFLL